MGFQKSWILVCCYLWKFKLKNLKWDKKNLGCDICIFGKFQILIWNFGDKKKNYIYHNWNPRNLGKKEECVATRPSVFQLFVDVSKWI